jgi:hypothetical protein
MPDILVRRGAAPAIRVCLPTVVKVNSSNSQPSCVYLRCIRKLPKVVVALFILQLYLGTVNPKPVHAFAEG